ncbi:MAG: hypothetical protein WC655_27340 [Candidatus Hydrogenedentales bacterium]|jgi:hypothetical protein
MKATNLNVETLKLAMEHAPELTDMNALEGALIGPLKLWQFCVMPGQSVLCMDHHDNEERFVAYYRVAENDPATFERDEVPEAERPLFVVVDSLRPGIHRGTEYRGSLVVALNDDHVAALQRHGWPEDLDTALAVLLGTPRDYVLFDVRDGHVKQATA